MSPSLANWPPSNGTDRYFEFVPSDPKALLTAAAGRAGVYFRELDTVGDWHTHLDGSWELADSSRKETCQEVIPDAALGNLVCLMRP